MKKDKQSKYEIVSLGYACMTRTFLTHENLIPSKANGRKSMIFDLMLTPTCKITQCIKNNFTDYFDDIHFDYLPDNRQNYWHNRIYDVYYFHDRDCKNNFNKFKKRYEQRINNFTEALNNSKYTYFVHIPKAINNNNINDDINNLYDLIKEIRAEKPFKLIIWDILDQVDNINSEITVIKRIHPQKSDENWWNPEYWNDDSKKWKQDLLNDTKKEIERDGFEVEYYENSPHKKSVIFSLFENEKLISLAKNIFKVENDHDNNRKILVLLGTTFTLKKLHNFNYSDIMISLDQSLGNQMFQWAFGKSFEAKKNINTVFDDSRANLKLDCFKLSDNIKTIQKTILSELLRKIIIFPDFRNKLTKMKITAPHYKEKTNYLYQPELFDIKPPAYISGYFQTEKYFIDIKEELQKDFELIKPLSQGYKNILDKIKNSNSVSLYIVTKNSSENILDDNFKKQYNQAIKYITDSCNEPATFFVFSDNINLVKSNFEFNYETIYIDISNKKQEYCYLELMKNCKHNIISDNSLSWWGAWLNKNAEKIVVYASSANNDKPDYDRFPNTWKKNV